MATVETSHGRIPNWEQVRDQWLGRLTGLIDQVESWVRAWGWATRRIEKKIEDSEVGDHRAPALLMQEGTTRILLEPMGRSAAPDTEGIVDLYLMPAYNDVAHLYYYRGGWHLHYRFAGANGKPAAARQESLTAEGFRAVLEEIVRRAA